MVIQNFKWLEGPFVVIFFNNGNILHYRYWLTSINATRISHCFKSLLTRWADNVQRPE